MAAPKGHAPYPGCEKGGAFGYLGWPDSKYKDELLHELGLGLVKWIQEKGNIYCKYFFCTKGISWDTVKRLRARSEFFDAYLQQAKEIQESKLVTEPYLKKADANHARFILARHHKGEWEDKDQEIDTKKVYVVQYDRSSDEQVQAKTISAKDTKGATLGQEESDLGMSS